MTDPTTRAREVLERFDVDWTHPERVIPFDQAIAAMLAFAAQHPAPDDAALRTILEREAKARDYVSINFDAEDWQIALAAMRVVAGGEATPHPVARMDALGVTEPVDVAARETTVALSGETSANPQKCAGSEPQLAGCASDDQEEAIARVLIRQDYPDAEQTYYDEYWPEWREAAQEVLAAIQPIDREAVEAEASLRTFGDAQVECEGVAAETVFAPEVTEDQREWYKRGAQTCASMMHVLSSRIRNLGPR